MRIGQYETADGERWCGVTTTDGKVIDLPAAGAAAGVDVPRSTTDLVADPEWRRKVDVALEYAEDSGVGVHDVDDLEQLAPITTPGKVVCVGLNDRDHAEEGDNPIPDEPVLFAKFPTSITGP